MCLPAVLKQQAAMTLLHIHISYPFMFHCGGEISIYIMSEPPASLFEVLSRIGYLNDSFTKLSQKRET